MKKLLLVLSVFALMSCSNDDDEICPIRRAAIFPADEDHDTNWVKIYDCVDFEDLNCGEFYVDEMENIHTKSCD